MMMDMKRSIIVIVMAALLGAGVLSGCIFETRTPEPPGSDTSSWVTPEVSSTVFQNMKTGLEELDGINYNRSLNELFTFIPLPDDVSQFPQGTFENWTADVEKLVVEGIVSGATAISVSFEIVKQTIDQSELAQYEANYTLTLTDVAAQEETFKGKGRFDITRSSRGWELVRWEDIERVSGFATWGFLRGRTRQQQEG